VRSGGVNTTSQRLGGLSWETDGSMGGRKERGSVRSEDVASAGAVGRGWEGFDFDGSGGGVVDGGEESVEEAAGLARARLGQLRV
jgi:hypothetical protein